MADDDDFVTLVEEDAADRPPSLGRPWTVAVIDDDPAVHEGTRFALYDYTLHGQGLELLAAYSAAEGRELMRANPDIAVVLLDVVMETDNAGLELVNFIRKDLKNETVRIILRTGQPGQAPERSVIVDYDINDYKAKTELTADKLFTSLTAALRSYQQIQRMVETRRGLEIIIDAASELFDCRSIQRLAEGVLTQIASLLKVDCAGILVLREGDQPGGGFSVLAASGCYRHVLGAAAAPALAPELQQLIHEAFARRYHEFQPTRSVLYMQTGSGREVVVLLEAARQLSDTDRALVEVFCSRFSIAFDNAILYEQLQRANAELEARVIRRTHELTAANHRLAAQTARLRRENAFKSEILGTVAHDLKNPLGVILGRTEIMTELIARAPVGIDKLGKQVEHIRDTAEDLTAMIDTLISDAMTDALDISLRRELVDISALVSEVVEANRPLADRKQQRIIVAAPPQHVASCDPDRVREAVDNLLSNAIKYSPVGGDIELSVDPAEAETVISVKDRGAGLSPEDLSRLFGRFQRLSAKPTAGESSTGLGLSIAKRIVDLHGGRILAESAGPGRGTTFVIALPIHPTAA
jgi:signal transduction histidine kinase/response regulator of citrate/malate metabolism